MMRKYLNFFFVVALWIFSSVAVVYAKDADFTLYFEQSSKVWNIPKPLLLAIAKKESSLYPWCINVEGRDFYPKSQNESLKIIKEAMAQGKSFDIGLMQINNFWLKHLDLQPEIVLEPQNNIHIGAWILAKEIERHGYSWKAIGSYHSPFLKNPDRAKRYAKIILNELRVSFDNAE